MSAGPHYLYRISGKLHSFAMLVGLLAFATICHAEGLAETSASFSIEATPTEIDEGEVVDFELINLRYQNSNSASPRELVAHPSKVNWQFEGESQATGALGLNTISHRFLNDTEEPSKIGVRHQNSDKVITIKVNNVKPTIYRIWNSTPTLKDRPIQFHALAKDPGLIDELTFEWDFDDGDTATGQHVEHTFTGTDDYQVTLKVSDEAEFDVGNLSVKIETGNSFSVSGGISLPDVEIEQLILAASTPNPMAKYTQEDCQIRLQMGNEEVGAAFVLTANLQPGFAERSYAIGKTTEWDGSHEDDLAAQGTFFADLGLSRDLGYREFNGRQVGGPFWSENGRVTIQKFDGKELELSFEATLLEQIPGTYDPRRVRVSGNLSTHVVRSKGAVLTGIANVFSAAGNAMANPDEPSGFKGANFYLCDKKEPETFDIESWKPIANEVGTDFEDPEIEVTFTEKIDPDTLADNAHLEFRAPGGIGKIPGGWEVSPDDEKTIRFIPQAHLLPAVKHCIRIDADEDGLRSTKGNMLEGSDSHGFSKAMRAACGYPVSAQLSTRRSAFATQVELESVRVDLYQSALIGDDTLLVTNKPTLARVFPYWHEANAIHPTAMVREFEARVEIKGATGAPYAPKKVKIKRPDKYTSMQKRNASNSINFFGWLPGKITSPIKVFAEITQLDQAGQPVDPVKEGEPVSVETWPHEDDTGDLKIQPFLIGYEGSCTSLSVGGCDWSTEVNEYWTNLAYRKVADAMEFATQNFPVSGVTTIIDGANTVFIQVTPPGPLGVCASDSDYYCYQPSPGNEIPNYELVSQLIFASNASPEADILLAIVPPGFFTGNVIGLQSEDTSGRLLTFAQIDEANAATITHEIGHFLELNHCPPGTDDAPCYLTPVQAIRMQKSGASGFNKHHIDGNQQTQGLHPLMNPTEWPVNAQFITVSQYQKLFSSLHTLRVNQAQTAFLEQQEPESSWLESLFLPTSAYAQEHGNGQQQLLISGMARNGRIQINHVKMAPASGKRYVPEKDGSYNLQLRNADGSIVETSTFNLIEPARWHGRTDPASAFRLSVPAPDWLHSIHITGPGGSTAMAQASPNKPEVTANVSTDAATGARILNWTATDADGDALNANVYLKGDEGNWFGVAIDLDASQLELSANRLPAARSVSARIIISDGFNSTSTELDLGSGAPLRVLVENPEDGASDVDVMPDISAWVSGPLSAKDSVNGTASLSSGDFTLKDAEGNPVPATVHYLAAKRIITLTPDQPLEYASRYQVTLAGITDRWNKPMTEAYSWSFETAAEVEDPELPPEVEEQMPEQSAEAKENSTNESAAGATSKGNSTSKESDTQTSRECSCECDMRKFADELCEFFCEDEFAACENP